MAPGRWSLQGPARPRLRVLLLLERLAVPLRPARLRQVPLLARPGRLAQEPGAPRARLAQRSNRQAVLQAQLLVLLLSKMFVA